LKEKIFVDANVFLRQWLADDPAQAKSAVALLRQAEAGKVRLLTGPPVFFEIAWVAGRVYEMSLGQILDYFEALMHFEGLEVTDRALVQRAMELSRLSQVDFADAYIAAQAQAGHCQKVATFNLKDFRKLGVKVSLS
jgi:predicted nucleic acid-binding protein